MFTTKPMHMAKRESSKIARQLNKNKRKKLTISESLLKQTNTYILVHQAMVSTERSDY